MKKAAWRVLLWIVTLAIVVSANAQSESDWISLVFAGGKMSGLYEVPPNNSPATGFDLTHRTALPPYQTSTYGTTLELWVGWGSQVDGVDLTGDLIAMTVDGPASTSGVGSALYTFAYAPGQPKRTDSFRGKIPLVPLSNYAVQDQVNDLRSGLWYINIRTTAFPDGEIRGQLVPVPEPAGYVTIFGIGLLGFGLLRRCGVIAFAFNTSRR